MGMAVSEDEDSVPFADADFVVYGDAEIVPFADEAIVACEGEDYVAFDTETEASDEATEPYKVNAEPDEDEDIPYEDAEPCAELAASGEETVASGDKETGASEDTEAEQPEETAAAAPSEHVEPEPELEVVHPFEETEKLAVVKSGAIGEVELLLELL
ncbi:hypothetical protein FVER53590_11606 [Fusarium verticillioides]|nr:hypothetical protein FVER14953_11606 [Fusarium verticillioides]RBR07109.1 hypothetical protein FVER53590_11606 [Fusarium verticillioides]